MKKPAETCKKTGNTISGVLAVTLALALAGCSSVPSYDISIYPAQNLVEHYGYMPSLEIDISGLNNSELGRIRQTDVDRYFEPGNALRKSLSPLTLKFSEEDPAVKSVSGKDSHWDDWAARGSENIVLIVNLPESLGSPAEDGRKLIVPIVKDGWFSRNTGDMYFEITPAGLTPIIRAPEMPEREKAKQEPSPVAEQTASAASAEQTAETPIKKE